MYIFVTLYVYINVYVYVYVKMSIRKTTLSDRRSNIGMNQKILYQFLSVVINTT